MIKRYPFLYTCLPFLVAGLFFISFPFTVVHAASAPPQIFTYQGRLTNNGGSLLTGTYYFKFSIWTTSDITTGTQLWPAPADPTPVSATVTSGVFTVNIGDTGYPYPLNLDFSANPSLYLQVRVSSSSGSGYETLSPRQQITSAAFAQVAGAVVGATTPSLFGTLTQATNSFVTIAATSTNSIPLSIVGFANQVANLFRIASSTGESLFVVAGNGNTGVGTSVPNRKFDILDANSVPQLRLSQSSSVYGEMQVDSAGDIHFSSPGAGIGGNVRMDTQNLFVCSGSSCGVDTPGTEGNVIVENAVILGNKFKLQQIDASTTVMYDTTNSPIFEFDEGQ